MFDFKYGLLFSPDCSKYTRFSGILRKAGEWMAKKPEPFALKKFREGKKITRKSQ